MSRGAKTAALLAILGMAGISLCTSVILAWSCCSADCERCPVSLYKDSSADLAKSIVSADVASSGLPVAMSFIVPELAPLSGCVLEAARSGFVRPMRN